MNNDIELYFDFGSPTTYLAYHRLKWIEKTYNVNVILTPVLLGGIFQATGNQSPVAIPLKAAWMDTDLKCYAELYDVEFEMNPYFPINTLYLMRGAIVAQREGFFDTYVEAVYDAMWHAPKNLGDMAVLSSVLESAGLDVDTILRGVNDPTVKSELKDNTETAVKRGVFGCPATFFRDQLYFGQDRLFMIEQQLSN